MQQTFGETVRHARLQRGLTQVELARKVGVHATYIGKIEASVLGNRGPSVAVIIRLASALHLDGKELLRLAGRDRDALLAMLLRRVRELETEVEELKNGLGTASGRGAPPATHQ